MASVVVRSSTMRRVAIVVLFLGSALGVGVACGGAEVVASPVPVAPEELIGKDSLKHVWSRPPPAASSSPAPSATPSVTASAAPPPKEPSDLEVMLKAMAIIKGAVPKWDQGAAAAIQFRNLQTKKTTTLILETARAPEEGKAYWHVYTLSKEDGGGNSWFVVDAREFKPGEYDCTTGAFMLAVAGTKDFKGDDPKALWSDNKGASCSIRVFKSQDAPEDRELSFRGKLVSNDGDTSFEILDGYMYLRRPPTAAVVQKAGPPPAASAIRTAAPKPIPTDNTPRLKLPR